MFCLPFPQFVLDEWICSMDLLSNRIFWMNESVLFFWFRMFWMIESLLLISHRMFWMNEYVLLLSHRMLWMNESVLLFSHRMSWMNESVLLFSHRMFWMNEYVLLIFHRMYWMNESVLLFSYRMLWMNESVLLLPTECSGWAAFPGPRSWRQWWRGQGSNSAPLNYPRHSVHAGGRGRDSVRALLRLSCVHCGCDCWDNSRWGHVVPTSSITSYTARFAHW